MKYFSLKYFVDCFKIIITIIAILELAKNWGIYSIMLQQIEPRHIDFRQL